MTSEKKIFIPRHNIVVPTTNKERHTQNLPFRRWNSITPQQTMSTFTSHTCTCIRRANNIVHVHMNYMYLLSSAIPCIMSLRTKTYLLPSNICVCNAWRNFQLQTSNVYDYLFIEVGNTHYSSLLLIFYNGFNRGLSCWTHTETMEDFFSTIALCTLRCRTVKRSLVHYCGQLFGNNFP